MVHPFKISEFVLLTGTAFRKNSFWWLFVLHFRGGSSFGWRKTIYNWGFFPYGNFFFSRLPSRLRFYGCTKEGCHDTRDGKTNRVIWHHFIKIGSNLSCFGGQFLYVLGEPVFSTGNGSTVARIKEIREVWLGKIYFLTGINDFLPGSYFVVASFLSTQAENEKLKKN